MVILCREKVVLRRRTSCSQFLHWCRSPHHLNRFHHCIHPTGWVPNCSFASDWLHGCVRTFLHGNGKSVYLVLATVLWHILFPLSQAHSITYSWFLSFIWTAWMTPQSSWVCNEIHINTHGVYLSKYGVIRPFGPSHGDFTFIALDLIT